MSRESTEEVRARRQSVALSRLYLDPSNFRFRDHPDYKQIPAEQVLDKDVQRRTTNFVLGRQQEKVRDLVASIKANGWLDIDPILVQRADGARYLVVEGNRRVATLKYLQRRHEEGAIDLGKLDTSVFSELPVVLYRGTGERERLVMMGLHHISGKRRWPAINRAQAMADLLPHFDGDPDAVCRALGVSKREFNLSVRTLALVDAYKQSDYGDQLESEQYNLFREVLRSEEIRTWIGWDHQAGAASNKSNLDRLFSWMSSEAESDERDDDDQNVEVPSNSDRVIATGGQVRELAKIIADPEAVKRLAETRSLQEATLSSDLLARSEVDGALKSCDRGVQKLNRHLGELKGLELDSVEQLIGKLQGVALARKRQPAGTGPRLPWQPFNEITQTQFSSISIDCFRGINGLVIDAPRRVNLIVGRNNAGKTSLLEAIYLLAHQNDERALINTICWRSRVDSDPQPLWLVEQIPPMVSISGRFDNVANGEASVEFAVTTEPEADVEDQTSFLSKLSIDSHYGNRPQSTEVVFFGDRPRRTQFEGQHWLCRSALTSPFSANHPDTLARCNKESLEAGTKQGIIEFIQERVDHKLRNIELADQFNRFLVSHEDFDKAPDLAAFGEGVRRVFEVGLLFAGVRGGVLLVDEFENAIHTELLTEFAGLVHDLATELNVQVFLSTHSKEAIDAFVLNGSQTRDVVGYAISRTDDAVNASRYDGDRLRRLHEAIDFDLRGI